MLSGGSGKKGPRKVLANIQKSRSLTKKKNSVEPKERDNLSHFQKCLHKDTEISVCEKLVLNIFPVICDSQVSLLVTTPKPHFPLPKKEKKKVKKETHAGPCWALSLVSSPEIHSNNSVT